MATAAALVEEVGRGEVRAVGRVGLRDWMWLVPQAEMMNATAIAATMVAA